MIVSDICFLSLALASRQVKRVPRRSHSITEAGFCHACRRRAGALEVFGRGARRHMQ
jgi:hypothetical protein